MPLKYLNISYLKWEVTYYFFSCAEYIASLDEKAQQNLQS